MPVVPEGDIVEGSTADDMMGTTERKMKSEEASPAKSTRSKRSTRQRKNDDESVASDDSSLASRSSHWSKRSAGAAADNDDTSTVSRRSTRSKRTAKNKDESALEVSTKRSTKSRKVEEEVPEAKEAVSNRARGKLKKDVVVESSVVSKQSTQGSTRKQRRQTKQCLWEHDIVIEIEQKMMAWLRVFATIPRQLTRTGSSS